MLGKKIGLDLGTSTVRLVVRGEGPPLSEPSLVGLLQGEYTASLIGMSALEHAGAAGLRLVKPMSGGLVVDTLAVRSLVQHLVTRAVGRQRIFKPDVVIAVTASLPGDQRRLLLDAAMAAGARTVYLLDACIAAALGAGLRLNTPAGNLVVDAGAGKTDIAVLATEGTDAQRSLPGHGGDALAASIAEHVRNAHGVTPAPVVIEEVLSSLARIGQHEERRLRVEDQEGRSAELTSTELLPLLESHVRPIADALCEVIEEAPRALLDDVRFSGGLLAGGASRLEGLDRYLSHACGVTMRRERDPQLCVVRGTGYALDNLDVLKRNFMYIR
ncbi:MAG: rod shape-determining protein [Candidatus Dormibacteraeota bacterium]|nr:rod shape-determining protein [Candidatus Dormibacteraeota bacterium]